MRRNRVRATLRSVGHGTETIYLAEVVGAEDDYAIGTGDTAASAWAALERIRDCDLVPGDHDTEALLGIGDE